MLNSNKVNYKIARKTFCDLALNEMLMSTDDVAACLGLKNTKYLKNYGRALYHLKAVQTHIL